MGVQERIQDFQVCGGGGGGYGKRPLVGDLGVLQPKNLEIKVSNICVFQASGNKIQSLRVS